MANDSAPGNPQSGIGSASFQYENAVFISYAWEDESERAVDELERAFAEHGMRIIRDKKDLNYKGSIEAFEQWIGQGQCVILVISDKYLRSEHCMWELVEVDKNRNLRERVFPIVLSDARIYKAKDRLIYIKHWDEQIEQLNQSIKQVNVMTNLAGITTDLDKYARIRANFDHLIDLLSDMNALTPETHAASGYVNLIRAVKNSLTRWQTHSHAGDGTSHLNKISGNKSEQLLISYPDSPAFSSMWKVLVAVSLIIPLLIRLLTGQNILYTQLFLSEGNLTPYETIANIFNEETGKFLVDLSPMLQISVINYGFGGDGNQYQYKLQTKNQLAIDVLPVEQTSEGWKIRLEHLLDDGIIQYDQVVNVPQNINLTIHQFQPSDNPILIYVVTDEVYPQSQTQRLFPYRETLHYQNVNIGQPGILNFTNIIDYSITPGSNPNIVSPGVGPIAAIFAVEFERGEPILRSNAVFVMRKGILHPNDILFNQNLEPFISQPLDFKGNRMVAFQSPESNTFTNDIMVSSIDASRIRRVAPAMFETSEEVICGWGDIEKNGSALYFLSSNDGGNIKVPYKVLVSSNGNVGQPNRLTTIPIICMDVP